MSEPLPNYVSEPDFFASEEDAMQFMAVKVRAFLRDIEEKNHLLLGLEENTWEQIYASIEEALGDFNVTQPPTTHKIEDVDINIRGLIYYRAAVSCLRSEAISQARNFLQYSDQGFSISEHDKMAPYLQLAATLEQVYEDKKNKLKASMNAASTWGGIWSEWVFAPLGQDTLDYNL